MSLMKNTKKQLVVLVEGHRNRMRSIQKSAGQLRKEIFDLDLDPEIRQKIVKKIDKHIDGLR
jgi:phosphoenolpyruvate synthase/pyruvate phosphate dikinase